MLHQDDAPELARQNWQRWQYAKESGHDEYVETALRNEEYYLGGGLQWSEQDRTKMKADKRFMGEINHVLPIVQTATGLQLHSRVDMQFLPRGEGADEDRAETITKVVRQVCDHIEYHWKESQMFEDGLIDQRGYIEFRVTFDKNLQGEIDASLLDPMDVHPDPDGNSYAPNTWKDVLVTRWLTADEVADRYGKEKLSSLHALADAYFEDDEYERRHHFGERADGGAGWHEWVRQTTTNDKSTRLFLVLDRQFKKFVNEEVLVYYTGEIKPTALMTEDQINAALENAVITKMEHERIYWAVTSGKTELFADWSPYSTFTVIPYFPIFRRGKTRGMVDNLRSPQDIENKAISLEIEIATKVSNAGWEVQEGSLANMEPEDLEKWGSKNGLVLVWKKGYERPQKIQMQHVPQGISKIADKGEFAMKTISGISDSLQGQQGNEVSGKAIQSKQYMGQTQMGRPFDNLAYSRRLCARKILELIQLFYTEERVFRITDPDTGKLKEELVVNMIQDDGSILNDITIGKYDVVVTDTPTHATFEAGQFTQMLDMLDRGVPIPPARVVKASSLKDKHEISEEVANANQAPPDPSAEAKAEDLAAAAQLKRAQTEKVKADTVNANVDALYSGIQTAGVIAQQPTTAGLGDQIVRSAGFEDKDKPPIFPQDTVVGSPLAEMGADALTLPPNTNPTTPVPVPKGERPSPFEGANEGIETQRIEAV